ncbi:MAG: peptidase M56, partial [Lysobacteraceae bacterium]
MNEWFGMAATSLAWALIDFLWQGLLVGWVCALLLALMRKARPQARYLVACGALLLCAALPLGGMISRMAEADAGVAAVVTASSLPLAAAGPVATVVSALPAVDFDAGRFAGWEAALQERLPVVVLLWALGAGL